MTSNELSIAHEQMRNDKTLFQYITYIRFVIYIMGIRRPKTNVVLPPDDLASIMVAVDSELTIRLFLRTFCSLFDILDHLWE